MAPEHEMEVDLIWQTLPGEQTQFELEYITELLFKKFSIKKHFDNKTYKTVINNAVIIYSNDSAEVLPEFLHYLNKFIRRGFRFYLVHLSNENLKHNYWYYKKAAYVFRNYYDPLIKADNVLYIPLGLKSGYLNKDGIQPDCDSRDIDVAFIGHPKSDRFELIEAMEKCDSHYLHKTNAWNCATALTTAECIEIYKKTKYAPAPMGNVHPDSFRLCETLEWGCIPIVKKINGQDYFKNVFGDHPFKVVDNWSEINGIIAEKNHCADHEIVRQWYHAFKENLQETILGIIKTGGLKNETNLLTKSDLKFESLRIRNLTVLTAKNLAKAVLKTIGLRK